MKLRQKCTGCSKTLKVPVRFAGKTIACPACGVRVLVSRDRGDTVSAGAVLDSEDLPQDRANAAVLATMICLWGAGASLLRRSSKLTLAALYGGVAAGAAFFAVHQATVVAVELLAPSDSGYLVALVLGGAYGGLLAAGATFGACWGHAEGPRVGVALGVSAGLRAALWFPLILIAVALAVLLPCCVILLVAIVKGGVFGSALVVLFGVMALLVLPVSAGISAVIFASAIERGAGGAPPRRGPARRDRRSRLPAAAALRIA